MGRAPTTSFAKAQKAATLVPAWISWTSGLNWEKLGIKHLDWPWPTLIQNHEETQRVVLPPRQGRDWQCRHQSRQQCRWWARTSPDYPANVQFKTHLAFVRWLCWRVPKMTCHLLQHFMLVSARGVLAIAFSGLLVKIVGQHVFDNLPGRQVALPPCHLCRFLQPLWPLFSPLVENDQIRYQGDGQAIEVTSSNVFLLAFLLTYSSNSSGFAFSSRDISAYWASSPAIKIGNLVSAFSRFFSLTAREVKFEAGLWPPPSLFPHDASQLTI